MSFSSAEMKKMAINGTIAAISAFQAVSMMTFANNNNCYQAQSSSVILPGVYAIQECDGGKPNPMNGDEHCEEDPYAAAKQIGLAVGIGFIGYVMKKA